MLKIKDGKPLYRCYLALLSVGATISDSIATGPAKTVARMEDYVRAHQSSSISAEALRTVFALQDGVTKDHRALAEGRGGTGLQDIFELFEDLGATPSPVHDAAMVIISGSTCIRLAVPYMKGHRKSNNSERELWFNQLNEPSSPPDRRHVFALPGRLNGTLVSMVLTLDPLYLEVTANADDQSGSTHARRGKEPSRT